MGRREPRAEGIHRERSAITANLGTPSSFLKGADLTLRLTFADNISNNIQKGGPTEEIDSRSIFTREPAFEKTEPVTSSKSILECASKDVPIEEYGSHTTIPAIIPRPFIETKNAAVSSNEGTIPRLAKASSMAIASEPSDIWPRQKKSLNGRWKAKRYEEAIADITVLRRILLHVWNFPRKKSYVSTAYPVSSSPEDDQKTPDLIYEIDGVLITHSAPSSVPGSDLESQPDLLSLLEEGNLGNRLVDDDRKDLWKFFEESPGTLLDGLQGRYFTTL
ncbi:hypothetical protein NHQ30_005633 [Ciborinia camelliae]|nr:hypothetical protein NHQ30_005633 [Ciborinia camelliae]